MAVVAGVVGFFVVLRGSAFPAHAIPNGAFAGAAGANLLGVEPLLGLGVSARPRRARDRLARPAGRHDVATALALVMMLALGAVFLSRSSQYEPEIFSLLFGEVLGVSTTEFLPVAALAVVCIVAIVALYRPLMLSSIVPEIAEAKGVSAHAHRDGVPRGPRAGNRHDRAGRRSPAHLQPHDRPACRRPLVHRPARVAIVLSVAIALVTVWSAIAISYVTNWPIGFFVGTFSALAYGVGRAWAA